MVSIYGEVSIYGHTPHKCKGALPKVLTVSIYVGSLVHKDLELVFAKGAHLLNRRVGLSIYGQSPRPCAVATEPRAE